MINNPLLEYSVTRHAGEGYVASCLVNPQISVFSREDDELLKKGIHAATKIYAELHPTEENEKIRKNEFQMQLVD